MNYWTQKMIFPIVIIALTIAIIPILHAEPTINALIITGQNNHRWDISTPILKDAMEKSGLFKVDVLQSPGQGEDFSSFNPEFQKYQVVVLDYNGDPWPDNVKHAFVSYVENGGGVVVYHAANNAFPEWQEFNKIIGLGGWGNRDERWGPYVRWRDGKVVKENIPGPGGAHGTQHAFQVVIRYTNHPITKGLPKVWLHAKDELYSHLRGPAENLTVLATAYSDPAEKGSGEHEPILFTIQYGKGRIFQTALGHPQDDTPVALQCAGFLTTFLRGAEWCATGNVTQPVPEDFPGPHETRIWEENRHIPFTELLERIKNYKELDSLVTITQINEYLRVMTSDNRSLENCEKEMIKFLLSDATNDAKKYICSKLGELGSQNAVPVLSDLLKNPDLFDPALFALKRIPGEVSARSLRDALQTVEGKKRIGIITALGLRKDVKSIPSIALFLKDDDPEIAISAGSALSLMEEESALSALWTARSQLSEPVKLKITEHTLNCADKVLSKKKSPDALSIVRTISTDNALPSNLRIASLRTLLKYSEKEGAEIVIKSLRDPDPNYVSRIIGTTPLIKNKQILLNSVCKEIASLAPEYQVQFIELFASQKRDDILPFITNSINSENSMIREACIKALGILGKKSEVELLIPIALGEGNEAELAKASLASLQGEDVGKKMLEILKKPEIEPNIKKLLLPLVADRKVPGSEPVILKSAGDADPECRISALKSLIEQPNAEMLDTVLQILPGVGSDEEKELFEELILKIVSLNPDDTEKQLGKIATLLDSNPTPVTQSVLLGVLAKSGHAKGWEKLNSYITPNTPAEKLEMVLKALNNWPDDTPVPALIDFTRQNPNLPQRDLLLEIASNLIQKAEISEEEMIQGMTTILELNPSTPVKKTALEKIALRKVDSSLPLLIKYLHESEDTIKETLIRSLSNWKNAEPLSALMEVARTTENDAIRRQALAGVVQLSDNISKLSSEQRTKLFNDVLALSTKPEVLKGVIGALQNTSYPEALTIVSQFMDNDQVKGEAEVAIVKLSKTLVGIAPDLVTSALEKVIAQGQLELIKQEAQKTLEIIPKFEDFITTWMVSGPYVNDEINTNMLYEFVFPPEKPE